LTGARGARGHVAATNERELFATTRQPHAPNRLICV
jgi:hypothetical protein